VRPRPRLRAAAAGPAGFLEWKAHARPRRRIGLYGRSPDTSSTVDNHHATWVSTRGPQATDLNGLARTRLAPNGAAVECRSAVSPGAQLTGVRLAPRVRTGDPPA
jgi:hypothetical protein